MIDTSVKLLLLVFTLINDKLYVGQVSPAIECHLMYGMNIYSKILAAINRVMTEYSWLITLLVVLALFNDEIKNIFKVFRKRRNHSF